MNYDWMIRIIDDQSTVFYIGCQASLDLTSSTRISRRRIVGGRAKRISTTNEHAFTPIHQPTKANEGKEGHVRSAGNPHRSPTGSRSATCKQEEPAKYANHAK